MNDDESTLSVRFAGPAAPYETVVEYNGERVAGVRAVRFESDCESGVPVLELEILEYEIDVDFDLDDLGDARVDEPGTVQLILEQLTADE